MLAAAWAITSFLTLALSSPILKQNEISNSSSSNLGFVEQLLVRGLDFYAIPLTFGSDNQTLLLKLDTTTSDFWVNSDINEFCLAYYSIPGYFNTTSPAIEWNKLNSELRDELTESVDQFEEEGVKSLANISTAEYSSFFEERKSAFQSALSVQKESITAKLDSFIKTATSDVDSGWRTFTTGIPSAAENFGRGATSKGGAFATHVTSFAESVATEVTSVAGSVVTLITKEGQSVASDVTSKGGQLVTQAASVGRSVATDVTSEFGAVTSGAANGWDSLTSGVAGLFGGLKKRNEEKEHHINTHLTAHSGLLTPSRSQTSQVSYSTRDFLPEATAVDFNNVTAANETFAVDSLVYKLEHDCSLYGVYNDSSSSSFRSLADDVLFIPDSAVFGIVGNDTIAISNHSFETTFGVADSSDSNIGVLGIGKSDVNSSFKSFPEVLVDSGVILTPLYSLYINSFAPKILFGAIDYGLIMDNITFFPLLNDTTEIAFNLTGLDLAIIDEQNNSSITHPIAAGEAPAVVDITTNSLLLPKIVLNSLVEELNSTFNVDYSQKYGRYVLNVENNTTESTGSGNSKSSNTSIEDVLFSFSIQDSTYEVPLLNFAVPIFDDELVFFNESNHANSSFYFDISNSTEHVLDTQSFILSILPSDNNTIVLGLDFFMDSIVTVVDLESEKVGFASSVTDFEDSESFILLIENDVPLSLNSSINELSQ